MEMNLKKRHKQFVKELRSAVVKEEKIKKNKFKVIPCEEISEYDESGILAELDATYDEFFDFDDDDWT